MDWSRSPELQAPDPAITKQDDFAKLHVWQLWKNFAIISSSSPVMSLQHQSTDSSEEAGPGRSVGQLKIWLMMGWGWDPFRLLINSSNTRSLQTREEEPGGIPREARQVRRRALRLAAEPGSSLALINTAPKPSAKNRRRSNTHRIPHREAPIKSLQLAFNNRGGKHPWREQSHGRRERRGDGGPPKHRQVHHWAFRWDFYHGLLKTGKIGTHFCQKLKCFGINLRKCLTFGNVLSFKGENILTFVTQKFLNFVLKNFWD